LVPLKEALGSYLGRTPEQIRRTLIGAAPRLLDAVPFVRACLGSIGEKLAEVVELLEPGFHGVGLGHLLESATNGPGALCIRILALRPTGGAADSGAGAADRGAGSQAVATPIPATGAIRPWRPCPVLVAQARRRP
jgi:hypothetical protein